MSKSAIRSWIRRKHYKLEDIVLDYGETHKWVDRLTDHELFWKVFEVVPKKILCKLFGHYPTMDHCGMPDHDYCSDCEILMPGKAKQRAL